MGEAGGPHGRK